MNAKEARPKRTWTIDDVVAERHLEWADPAGTKHVVKVRFNRPMADAADWLCAYEIVGGKKYESRAAYGVDSVQAFQLALQMAGAELEYFARTWGGRLTFNGIADFGFLPNSLIGEGLITLEKPIEERLQRDKDTEFELTTDERVVLETARSVKHHLRVAVSTHRALRSHKNLLEKLAQ